MIRLTLTRNDSGEEGTFGKLEGEALCMDTGELPWHDNMANISCILPGEYMCIPHESQHLGKVYWLQNVPGRTYIYIHAANWMGDISKGWKSDLLGCIAVGFGRVEDAHHQDIITNSRKALDKLFEYTNGESFLLTIINKTNVRMEV